MGIFKRLFSKSQDDNILDAVTFDANTFEYRGITDGNKVWHNEDGDGIGLFFFAVPPDLPANAGSLDEFHERYRAIVSSDAKVLALELPTIDGCRMVETIIRLPQQPSSMAYIGSFTMPFRDFSFVLTIQCLEHGVTGLREAILLDSAFRAGEAELSEDEGLRVDFDPYDAQYDDQFPDHPLSRLRRLMPQIKATLRVLDDVKSAPTFPLPSTEE